MVETMSLGNAYRGAHQRIDMRVRSLVSEGRTPADIAVPACPGWSVHSIVSHLAGIVADAFSGRLRGIPDDAHTAGQVEERADHPVEAVLGEWASYVDDFALRIDRADVLPAVVDALTHEGDIREALDAGMPPADGWRDVARRLCDERITQIDRPGSLTVSSGGDAWSGGAGGDGPSAVVDVEPWELFRAVMSRRSRDQMRSWPWAGDPDPWLGPLTVFGVREDDQPTVAAGS